MVFFFGILFANRVDFAKKPIVVFQKNPEHASDYSIHAHDVSGCIPWN